MSSPDAAQHVGERMHELIAELYPVCRSITGNGLRSTLRRLQCIVPMDLVEVPSGTQVLDWTVPKEWNIRDAWIKNSRGERIVDFAQSSLHVVNYSTPIYTRMGLDELRKHLHSLPEHPRWVPYRTSYYQENWGFCLTHELLESLKDDEYEVCIESSLEPGHLTYGEYLLSGQTEEEVLISCHSCHPSLANDNLSGMAVAAELARALRARADSLRLSYRFLFIPGTIGSIAWLARNQKETSRIKHGLVLSCLGDRGPLTYKQSRRGTALIDRAAEHVLANTEPQVRIRGFIPYGYDERQYCSPGFNLAVGCLTRTPNGEYAEYHTSADDVDFVSPEALAGSLSACEQIVDILEQDERYVSLSPYGEPQLGRRGLYRATGGTELPQFEAALLWALNLSDGEHSLLDIAERSGLAFGVLKRAADRLESHALLARRNTPESPSR